jgi:predicted Zn-dependent protease with MMP-like domain
MVVSAGRLSPPIRRGTGTLAPMNADGAAHDPEAVDDRSAANDRSVGESDSDSDPFDDWVDEAIDALPAVFRDRLDSVAIIVEDLPSPSLLASLGVPGLYGLYQGVPRSALGADYAATPSRITIYRGSIRRSFPTETAQRAKVFDTVHHEIAHHFGISDARLRELKAGTGHNPGR